MIDSGQYQNSTGGLPSWYLERPAHVRGDEFYLVAFWELSTERQYGQVLGPIPHHFIVEYGYRKRLGPAMIEVLVSVIRELDEKFLEWQREEQRQRNNRPKK